MNGILLEDRPRKSVDLSPEEKTALTTWVKSFKTKLDAAFNLRLDRTTLDNILLRGTAHPSSLEKIRSVLFPSQSEASAA